TVSIVALSCHHTSTTQISTLSLHDALPIFLAADLGDADQGVHPAQARPRFIRHDHHDPARSAFAVRLRHQHQPAAFADRGAAAGDRKSTRLNSSHGSISYAVFCLKKKK